MKDRYPTMEEVEEMESFDFVYNLIMDLKLPVTEEEKKIHKRLRERMFELL